MALLSFRAEALTRSGIYVEIRLGSVPPERVWCSSANFSLAAHFPPQEDGDGVDVSKHLLSPWNGIAIQVLTGAS